MTVEGMTPHGDASESAVVAESLSTVGYAMFAWLQTGPLEAIPSMSEFQATLATEPPESQSPVAPAEVPQPDTAFGQAEVGEDMGAVTQRPATDTQPSQTPGFVPPPLPDPVPVSASSVQVVPPVPGEPVPAGASSAADVPAPAAAASDLPQPKNPLGQIPEYTGNQTLQMLQEISFLDE